MADKKHKKSKDSVVHIPQIGSIQDREQTGGNPTPDKAGSVS